MKDCELCLLNTFSVDDNEKPTIGRLLDTLFSYQSKHQNGDRLFQQIEVIGNAKTSTEFIFITKEDDYNEAIMFIDNHLPNLYWEACMQFDKNMDPKVSTCKGLHQQLKYMRFLTQVADNQTSTSSQSQTRTRHCPPVQIQYSLTLVGQQPIQDSAMNAWQNGPPNLSRQESNSKSSIATQHQTNQSTASITRSDILMVP